MVFEFAEVNSGFPIRAGQHLPAHAWKQISKEAGDKMVTFHTAVVYARTQPRPNGPRKYGFLVASADDKVVKYKHCHRDSNHAILVRKSEPYTVQVSLYPFEEAGSKLVLVRADPLGDQQLGDDHWYFTKRVDFNLDLTIGDFSTDIIDSLVEKNTATRQSKIDWRFRGKSVIKTKKILKL